MTTFNTILIKYSTVTQEPTSLLKGELAYSEASGKLFVGNEAGQAVYIGGADLVSRVGGVEALVSQLQDLVTQNNTDITGAVNALTARVGDLETFKGTAEGQITAIQTELGTVDSRIADAKTDVEGQIATASTTAATNLAAEVSILVTQMGINAQAAADALTAATDAQAAINTALSGQITQVAQDLSDFEGETAQALAGLQSQIDQTSNGAIAALQAKDLELEGDIDALDARVDDVETLLNGGAPTFDSLTVTGDLVVQGQTVTVDSEVTTIKDPVITLGEGSSVADGLGRGIEYKYFDGSAQKAGFFGVDTVDGKFKFIPDAAASGNAFSGDAGVIVANVEGSATRFAADQVINVDGEVTGTVSFNGTAAATLTVEVVGFSAAEPDSVVRRDAAGVSGFNAVHVAGLSQMAGIDGLVGTQMSNLSNFVINGGEF